MKLFEFFPTMEAPNNLTEGEIMENVQALLADMDWHYDLDPLNDERRFERGVTQLRKIEESMVVLFAKNKESALDLWESHCPFSIHGMINHSIFRK